ncbi:paramyosin-like [Penaeus japonicus]|uniref:paramyosin-like n=1 Tax=Penaeus japonicus TaxID=27405 RepID=UPI001C712F9E|nr:paramyosin-like [Penaeus japonicus]
MGYGRRCGCWALSELELERSRHQATLEENTRYQRHIQDLRDELSTMHATVADLERRYSDLSARYRGTVASLDEVNDTTLRLKDHSSDLTDENRRLRLNCEKLQEEARSLREQLQNALSDAEDEHRRRVSSEVSLSRDLADRERKFTMKLRRANSLHDMDKVHLRQDLDRLYHALRREKYTNKYLRDYRHHYYCGHHDCVDCVYDPMLLD